MSDPIASAASQGRIAMATSMGDRIITKLSPEFLVVVFLAMSSFAATGYIFITIIDAEAKLGQQRMEMSGDALKGCMSQLGVTTELALRNVGGK